MTIATDVDLELLKATSHLTTEPTDPLEKTVRAFQRWLHLPDHGALLAVLATVAANRLEGDPVWLVLVGPPGGGKSELLGSLGALEDVHPVATLTEASLLSGVPKKEHANDAKGGLLREIGDFGILVCKDFGSVLNMNRDSRQQVLAALREVYDGSWTRYVGTSGGQKLSWAGKVGLVAGCTPIIDRHASVMGAMGERFILFRLPDVDGEEQAHRALEHAGKEQAMRSELAAAVAELLDSNVAEPRERDDQDANRLVSLATLVVCCRSAVERDSYSREIELIPGSEAPTRLVVVLARLLEGLDAIGADRAAAWPVITKAALDSIPQIRRVAIENLFAAEWATTTEVAEAVSYPTTTARRALEDLTAHGVTVKRSNGQGKADSWALTEFARRHYTAAMTFPEKSVSRLSITTPSPSESDISGTVDSGELDRLEAAYHDAMGEATS
ncbi:MAG TPA: hypothetical protein VF094_08845 [Gaiellaceae bacterium]